MEETKSLLQSRTIWGAAIAIAAGLAGLFGYSVDAAMQDTALALVQSAATLVGGAIALYGRVRATRRIG